MIIPKKEIKEIISGILPVLEERYEETEVMKKRLGSSLKNFLNIHFDGMGKPIIDNHEYTRIEKISVKVNHTRRIRTIIDQAKNLKEMQERLGYYVAKNAKSKQEVLDIAHTKMNKHK